MRPFSLVVSVLAMFVMTGVQHGGTPGVPRRGRLCQLGTHHKSMPLRHPNSKEQKCKQVFQSKFELNPDRLCLT